MGGAKHRAVVRFDRGGAIAPLMAGSEYRVRGTGQCRRHGVWPKDRGPLADRETTYHYRLYPTGRQAAALDAQLGGRVTVQRRAEQRRVMWREHGVSVRLSEQSAELKAMRAEGCWMRP